LSVFVTKKQNIRPVLNPLLAAMGVHPLRPNAVRPRPVVWAADVREALADLELHYNLLGGIELDAEDVERQLIAVGLTVEQIRRAVVRLYNR
jgi:hypothetical protein